jgi:sec-independent protein translocase protein TatA
MTSAPATTLAPSAGHAFVSPSSTLGFTSLIPGNFEWLIILAIGLLLFGRRLPEVGRNIGKTVVEFRRGIKDIEHEVDTESRRDRSLPASEEPAAIENDDRAVAQQKTAAKPSEA